MGLLHAPKPILSSSQSGVDFVQKVGAGASISCELLECVSPETETVVSWSIVGCSAVSEAGKWLFVFPMCLIVILGLSSFISESE